jgi:hypothetical protein
MRSKTTPTLQETTLAVLPSISDDHRVELVHVSGGGSSHMELRQQSWGDGVGWFTQSSVRLEPQQVAALKQSLGIGSSCPTAVKQAAAKQYSQSKTRGWSPRIVRAETA